MLSFASWAICRENPRKKHSRGSGRVGVSETAVSRDRTAPRGAATRRMLLTARAGDGGAVRSGAARHADTALKRPKRRLPRRVTRLLHALRGGVRLRLGGALGLVRLGARLRAQR